MFIGLQIGSLTNCQGVADGKPKGTSGHFEGKPNIDKTIGENLNLLREAKCSGSQASHYITSLHLCPVGFQGGFPCLPTVQENEIAWKGGNLLPF